jgi:hypothetical protein
MPAGKFTAMVSSSKVAVFPMTSIFMGRFQRIVAFEPLYRVFPAQTSTRSFRPSMPRTSSVENQANVGQLEK